MRVRPALNVANGSVNRPEPEYKSQITASAADCSCPLTRLITCVPRAIGAWRCTCPEPVGVNLIVEGRAVDGHLFGEQLGAGAQFAVHKYGVIVVCCRGIDDLAARFGHGKTNLGAGFKAALPHVFALGDVQQRARGKRHGVDGHAVVCAAPAHGWHAVVVGNHFDAGTPIEAAGCLVAGHALDGNGHVDMAESAHLFGDGGWPST